MKKPCIVLFSSYENQLETANGVNGLTFKSHADFIAKVIELENSNQLRISFKGKVKPDETFENLMVMELDDFCKSFNDKSMDDAANFGYNYYIAYIYFEN